MTRLRNFKTVALLIVLVAAATLAAAPGDGGTPITTDALGMDAAMYASDYGVTLEEAKRRLGLQGSAGALQADLMGSESATFGGLWIQHEPDFKIVVRFTRDGESTVRPYVTGGALSGIVEVRTADATLNDLKTAQASATTLARGFGIPVESQIDVIENRVKLFVVDKAGLDSSLTTSAVQLPSKVDVVTVSELSRTTTDISGGLTVNGCTTGFSVRHSSGTEGITTAAHCPTSQSYNGTNLPYQGEAYGTSYDLQWHSTPGFTVQNAVYDGSGYRPVYATRHRDLQAANQYVCKYGDTTGYGCGYIVTTSFLPSISTYCPTCSWLPTWVRVHRHGVDLSDSGDSGGPWFSGSTAYGTMKNAFLSPTGSWDGIYMPINYVSFLGLTVLTD